MCTMDIALTVLADLLAICILVFCLYLPRHHRRDLVVAYLGVNVGVMAVAIALVDTAVAAGLGLGLFGVLSIIRLRSDELAQHEVAYYFSALAIGLLAALSSGWTAHALMALVVLVIAVVDHPRISSTLRRQVVHLDRAISDEGELREELTRRLGGHVLGFTVQRVDFVTDVTVCEVRFRAGAVLTEPAVAA